jgi:hypothetical protein
MLIENLSYFENVLENASISGSAGTTVIADASAFGSATVTLTRTNSMSRLLPRSGSLSIGRGFGFAKGGVTSAQVTTAGYGDIVVGSTNSTPNIRNKPVDVATGVVVAIVLPA